MKVLTINLNFYGSSPVCKFEAKCTKNFGKELFIIIQNQRFISYKSQSRYKTINNIVVFQFIITDYPIKLCTFADRKENILMNRIKEFLDAKGITQTDLAHRLGKSFNMVNLYATNKVQPPIPVLYQIADILNIDVRELLVSSNNK